MIERIPTEVWYDIEYDKFRLEPSNSILCGLFLTDSYMFYVGVL